MSEQDGTQSPAKQRRSRKTSTANYQNGKQDSTAQRPDSDNTEAWKTYWKTQDQPWRTEPEIDKERQKFLAQRRLTKPDTMQGIYPFKDIKLDRADLEWLLATHESVGAHGPVDWNDVGQQERKGLDLRGANLCQVDLRGLLLAGIVGGLNYFLIPSDRQREAAAIHLERAYLWGAHLEGADLSDAFLDSSTMLNRMIIYNKQLGAISLADIHWGDVNVAVVDWSAISVLGDELTAQELLTPYGFKDKQERLYDYQTAVRAYRQLAVVLQNQGLNEDAARFAYRAQLMQRRVFWRQHKFAQYLGSLFLALLSGYGYKVVRCFIVYTFVIGIFATIYHLLGTHPAWNEAIVISMTAFHGRGFFPEQFHPGDPQALAASIEAFVGLLVEITLIVTLTQRFFGK